VKDLVALVPDKNVKFGIEGLFSRFKSLSIKPISYDVFVHPQHDPGIFHGAADFLRAYSNEYSYSLVFLDYEGSGQETIPPDEIAKKIKVKIERSGWLNRVEIIVFIPEFEVWMWTNSPHIAKVLGWNNYLRLKNWLVHQGLWEENTLKPKRPKEALEVSLQKTGIPRSSSIYL
jgi:hypothetical protein